MEQHVDLVEGQPVLDLAPEALEQHLTVVGVGIQHHLFAGQAGGFHSQTIQHLGLVMVDLVEAPGAQGIGCLLYTSSSPLYQ